jgi:hypothetical protein|tara:strand:+ start:245 stop:526 length:282 start_codon:yes stop_codon:yes gene_type:complete
MGKKKKEKVVDLKPEKITDEQLKKVQEIVSVLNKAQMELGVAEVRKHRMLHEMASFQDQLNSLQKEFEDQYGTFDINVNDGTINYAKDEPSDS